MFLAVTLLSVFFLDFDRVSAVGPPVPLQKSLRKMAFDDFLQQKAPFELEHGAGDATSLPGISSVPLVMKILYEEAERVNKRDPVPENGDFQPLARSIQPISVEELGLQRVILDFPSLRPEDIKPGDEAWLVFHLQKPHILDNNCSQMLTVYENDKSKMRPVVTVPVNYKHDDPLLLVNITRSLRGWRLREPSYIVLIKDSTSYTRDQHLYSFSNYIDCSLARACEVLELHDPQSSPVLLLLSPELSGKDLLESQGGHGRFRRSLEPSDENPSEEDENPQEDDTSKDGKNTSSNSEDDEGSQKRKRDCHFEEWVVNIEQLDWDWLVYPERIPLNLCTGKCPVLLDRYFNATSHAVARGLHRLVLGPETKPDNKQPCCVPVKYRRFTMLIEKAPGVISLETSSDLSASQCGCR